jgi:putative nucleotidyltransferase with HDIG domain
MPSLRAYLQTKVARRIFGLFFVCAVLPTVTLIAAGYWLVTRELRSQAVWQLSQAGKISGALLLARLHAADGELAEVRQTILNQRKRPIPVGRLRGVMLVREGLPPSILSGAPPAALPPVTRKTIAHLAQGRAALLIGPAERQPGVYLVRAVSHAHLWGEISPAYLWGDREAESIAPTGVDLCVYAASFPVPLYCSPGAPVIHVPGDRQRREQQGESGSGRGSDLVKGTSSIFLGYDFSAPPWTVVLEQPVISASAMEEFGRTVILTGILGLSLVVFASNVLLRQRLDPVARLQEGTRRLAAGDFGVPVDVATGDEFEDLAASFNSMATSLHQQFELLDALQRVDREALEGHSTATIVVTVMDQMRELTADRCHASIVIARRNGGTALLTLWRTFASGALGRAEARVAASLLDEWQGRPPVFQVSPDGAGAGMLGAFSDMRAARPLVLPLLEHGACFGAVVLTPVSGGAGGFSPADWGPMRQLADQTALAISHHLSIERLSEMSWGTLEALARTIDANSPWTAGHSERVTRLATAIGRQMALGEDEIDRLHRGGLLHDVGKIGISPAILDKPGALTPEEMAIVREHPVVGARILEPIHAFADVIGIVRHHHERFNGQGYPDGLKGQDIPQLARVTAVADVYDALVSERPYRARWNVERAIQYIADMAGTHFDPAVVRAFLVLVDSAEWTEATSALRTARRQLLAGSA